MVNTNLFSTNSNAADTVNAAGGKAYSLPKKAALAQYALTGCFNSTFYSTDKDQLSTLLTLSKSVDDAFLAKLAIYSRQEGYMKDMPAALLAILCQRTTESKNFSLLEKTFVKVVDSPKMLRNFIQIVRSGATGRKSLGTKPKKLIQNYLNSLTDEQLFKADVGNKPSLQDIIKMVHPKPSNEARSALYAYLLGKDYKQENLVSIARDFEQFKKELGDNIPNVPFQMLTALPLTNNHWKQIAGHATWNQIRMNLNTFNRHGVFENKELITSLANKLSDKEQVLSSKTFPYQIFSAFINSSDDTPPEIKLALQDAADHALENIPSFKGKVYVMVDASGSMSSPITGNRGSATSKMACIDIAGLFASAILRKNPSAEIIPFDTTVHTNLKLNPRDSIMTNANRLSALAGGGTNCGSPLAYLNAKNAEGDLVIYISDNESWQSDHQDSLYQKETTVMKQWGKFKARNKNAKLVNIDIQPSTSTQARESSDILNIGGFSDNVFEVIAKFQEMNNSDSLWLKEIENVII